jgi:hypothetical protein
MSKYNHSATYSSMALFLALLVSLILLAACDTGADPFVQATPTTENGAVTNATVFPTPSFSPTLTADPTSVNQLIALFTAAGADVVNNGLTEQGLFPAEGIGLWHLTVNGATVNVYEFGDAAAREAVSSNISPKGDEYTVTEGDTTVTTSWDGEGLSRWWTLDNLLVHYSGLDEAVIPLLTTALGQPFADGSQPYRPEPYSGSIAGIGEYGVSFQYDPYLAAGIKAQVMELPTAAPTSLLYFF